MGALTIRNIDDSVVAAIKRRAGERGISMEEEIRRLLSTMYSGGDQARGKEWARRQLERLNRGELPKADRDSVQEIRKMREERTEQLRRAVEGDGEPDR
jgi:plasmid stability protein